VTSSVYEVTVGERTIRVELRRGEDGLYARVDEGAEQSVRLDHVGGVLWTLTVGHRRAEVLASRGRDGVQVAIEGLSYTAEVVDDLHARLAGVAAGGAAQHGRRELKSPMPGLVVRVLHAQGDAVEAGQPLVVLQAMKMENELSLPRGGTIASVAVEAGQTVEQGQVLVVVE
jgi:biotin carboxyl carrier protein